MAWLVWVLGAQVGNDAVMRIGATLVLVAFALWAWRTWRGGGRLAWATAAIIGAVGGCNRRVAARRRGPRHAARRGGSRASQVAERRLGAVFGARASPSWIGQGRPVFIDFTAAWCITCQVNKRLVLTDARVAMRSRARDARCCAPTGRGAIPRSRGR